MKKQYSVQIKFQINGLTLYQVITRLKLDLYKTHLISILRSLFVSTVKVLVGTPEKVEYWQSGNEGQLFQSCLPGDSYMNNFEQFKIIQLLLLLIWNMSSAVFNKLIQIYRIFNFQVLLKPLRKCRDLMKNIALPCKNYY